LPNLLLIDTFVHLSAQPAELAGEKRAGGPALQQCASNRLQHLTESIKNNLLSMYTEQSSS